MKNNKGFTLFELLVVIIIIGIITILALPGIGQLQTRNRNKKFEAYKDSMESAGKLYTDSYSDDMFGMEGSGCYDIPYSELRGKTLIKEYEVDGIDCSSDKTFVQVKRENNKYSYAVSLYCTKKGKVVYDKTLTSCETKHEGVTEVPQININYTNNDKWSKSKNITITVSAIEGLIDNISIRYGFSTNPNVPPTNMQTHNYHNDYGKSSVTMTFEESGKNGQYYLFVEGDDVIDTGGRFASDKWSTVMKFDNTPPAVPVLNNPRNNTWTGIDFVNASKYVIGVTSSDAHSGISYYQYRYPNSEPNWKTYANSAGSNFTTPPFTKQRDEDVEIRACDYAGNCSGAGSSRIKIDLERPTFSLKVQSGNISISNPKDNVSGINTNSYQWSTGVKGESISPTNGTLYAKIEDNAGNTQTNSINVFATTKYNCSNCYTGSDNTYSCCKSYRKVCSCNGVCPNSTSMGCGYYCNGQDCLSVSYSYQCSSWGTCGENTCRYGCDTKCDYGKKINDAYCYTMN